MASNFEKAVKGGTKIKLAAPKPKYVEHILLATRSGEAGVAEVFRTLEYRIRDSTWTIVFKALIIVHLMIREGEPNVTLKYISDSPRKLAISSFSDVQEQGLNIRRYSDYLLERARSYRSCKTDFVRSGEGRLKGLSVDKGLLRETESVQTQIRALLRCDLFGNETENEVTISAFRLLINDLLALYGVMNEGTINVLEHYFEMSKVDADRALNIYKTFSKQTDNVVAYLGVARQYEAATRVVIPKLKHAPTGLTASLEEYLNDPDFEINRRQYLAQQEAKKSGRSLGTVNRFESKPKPTEQPSAAPSFPNEKSQATMQVKQEVKKPEKDLIDFFESIEGVGQNQQTMAQQPQQFYSNNPQVQPQQFQQQAAAFQSQAAFSPQQIASLQQYGNPFSQQNGGDIFGQPQIQQQQQQQQQPIQPSFSGADFGGYTPQVQQQALNFQPSLSSIPQNGVTSFPQQQSGLHQQQQQTNPFRQSIMPQDTVSTAQSMFASPITSSPSTRQSTNPFARSLPTHETGQFSNSPFTSPPPQQPQAPLQHIPPQRTGTNPFSRNDSLATTGQPAAPPLRPNPTGSTNPFRQSQFVNQQTGQGWQTSQGTIGGGLDHLETMPIFPRPGQA